VLENIFLLFFVKLENLEQNVEVKNVVALRDFEADCLKDFVLFLEVNLFLVAQKDVVDHRPSDFVEFGCDEETDFGIILHGWFVQTAKRDCRVRRGRSSWTFLDCNTVLSLTIQKVNMFRLKKLSKKIAANQTSLNLKPVILSQH
jgi:hypothetical protein